MNKIILALTMCALASTTVTADNHRAKDAEGLQCTFDDKIYKRGEVRKIPTGECTCLCVEVIIWPGDSKPSFNDCNWLCIPRLPRVSVTQ